MIHQRQCLALRLKPRDHLPGVHSQFDDFNRDTPFDRFALFSHVNHAEAAFADFFKEFVRSDCPPMDSSSIGGKSRRMVALGTGSRFSGGSMPGDCGVFSIRCPTPNNLIQPQCSKFFEQTANFSRRMETSRNRRQISWHDGLHFKGLFFTSISVPANWSANKANPYEQRKILRNESSPVH
jgi:hypothetical protein